MMRKKNLRVFLPLILILASCSKRPVFDDSVAVPGIYVEASGYVLFMRRDFIYRLCDAKECVEDKWDYTDYGEPVENLSPSAYLSTVRHSRSIVLKHLFKTKLGLKMDFDVNFRQLRTMDTIKNREEYLQTYKNEVFDRRMMETGDRKDDLNTLVLECEDEDFWLGLGFGGFKGCGFLKMTSFK